MKDDFNPFEGLINLQEALEMLKPAYNRAKLNRLAWQGKLPFPSVKIAGRWYVDKEAVCEYVVNVLENLR